MFFLLALRNLLRNRRRSLTTLSAIVVGLISMLIFGGYARNAILATQTGYVQYRGHLQIQHKGFYLYGSGNPTYYSMSNYQNIIDEVKNDEILKPMLKVVTPTLQLNGIAGHFFNNISMGIIAVGVIADDQNEMRKWDDYNIQNYVPLIGLEGTNLDAAIVGTGVARILQLCLPENMNNCHLNKSANYDKSNNNEILPDDIRSLSSQEQATGIHTSIEVLAASVSGAPNVVSLDVVSAENWGVKEIDDVLMLLHLEQAQRLIFGNTSPKATAIQIQLQHTNQIPFAEARLRQIIEKKFMDDQLQVIDYEKLTPIYTQIIQFFDSLFGFISILIWIIVLFTISNTMSMAVVERTAEIGTLRAIGQRRAGVRTLFLYEGLLLGIFGSAIGILLTIPIAYLINNSGLVWTPPGYSYAYPVRIRVLGDNILIFGSAASLIFVAVLSAWLPAKRAAKLNIVDALRYS